METNSYALVLRAGRTPGNAAPFRTCKLVDGEVSSCGSRLRPKRCATAWIPTSSAMSWLH